MLAVIIILTAVAVAGIFIVTWSMCRVGKEADKTISACKIGDIREVTIEELHSIIVAYAPQGRFYAQDGDAWVAVDNQTGDAWTEEFRTQREAIAWLNGEEGER